MRYSVQILVLASLLPAGCSPAFTSTPELIPTPRPSVSATAPPPTSTLAPSNTPTPTHLPNAIPAEKLGTSIFHFFEGNPVLQQSNNPAWDNRFIDPGAMVYHEGMFHSFYNGINGFPAPVGVGYATSSEGFIWNRQVEAPVLSARQLTGTDLLGSNFFVTSVLVEDDGTWVLYFHTMDGNNFNGPGEIGRATASSPIGPWTIHPEPMLSPGSANSWDGVQLNNPDVLRTEDGYIMYYDALGRNNASMIGMATSTDGIHWTKYDDPATNEPAFMESDPVLKGSEDSWDARRVIDPNVIKTPDGWTMIYLSANGSGKFSGFEFSFGVATGQDGIHWKKSGQNPVLSNKDLPQWSQTFLATVLYVKDTYYLYFDLVTPDRPGTNVYMATYTGPLK